MCTHAYAFVCILAVLKTYFRLSSSYQEEPQLTYKNSFQENGILFFYN